MYTLYYKPGACSLAVHALLREINMPFELEPSQLDGEANPKLLRVNPRGSVPVLQDGGFVLREGGAILSWLCDEHDSPLLPRGGEERANALQWLMFANATMHPAYGQAFFVLGQSLDASVKDALIKSISAKIQGLWNEVEDQLAQGDYICGSEITVADILLTVISSWTPRVGLAVEFGPRCKALFERISSRPAYQESVAAESDAQKKAA